MQARCNRLFSSLVPVCGGSSVQSSFTACLKATTAHTVSACLQPIELPPFLAPSTPSESAGSVKKETAMTRQQDLATCIFETALVSRRNAMVCPVTEQPAWYVLSPHTKTLPASDPTSSRVIGRIKSRTSSGKFPTIQTPSLFLCLSSSYSLP